MLESFVPWPSVVRAEATCCGVRVGFGVRFPEFESSAAKTVTTGERSRNPSRIEVRRRAIPRVIL